MSSGKEKSGLDEVRRKVKSILYEEPLIRRLKEKFNLSKDTISAATLIFRLFIGLGKGLSSSQKRSFSAATVYYAAKLIEGRELSKEELAEAVDVSPRTLARRFDDLEDTEESKSILEYVKNRMKSWSKRREKELQELF